MEKIAKYLICTAFDGDDRDFKPGTAITRKYKKLYVKNAVVTKHSSSEANFYLSNSPCCPSLCKAAEKGPYKMGFRAIA